MTSLHGKAFYITGPLCGESTGHWLIPLAQRAGDEELWCLLWCQPEQTIEQTVAMQLNWNDLALIWRHCNGNHVKSVIVLFNMSPPNVVPKTLVNGLPLKIQDIISFLKYCLLVLLLQFDMITDRNTQVSLSNNKSTLWWRHNDHYSVSNHQPHGCFLNRLFRRRWKKTSKLRVTGLCVGNSPGPVNSPHKGPVTRKMFPFDDVIMEHQLDPEATFQLEP